MDLDDMARRFADYRKYYPTDTEFRKEITQAVEEAYYKAGKTEEAIAVYRNYLQEHYDLEITQALTVALLKEKRYGEMEEYLSKIAGRKGKSISSRNCCYGKRRSCAGGGMFYQILSKLEEGNSRNSKDSIKSSSKFLLNGKIFRSDKGRRVLFIKICKWKGTTGSVGQSGFKLFQTWKL